GYDGPAAGEPLVALRRAADHARALAFTLAEGLVPSNVGRGYVLRRILRRAMMALRTLGVREPALYRLVGQVCEHMGGAYPELKEKAEHAALVVRSEEERFLRTLEQGIARYHEVVAEARAAAGNAGGDHDVPGGSPRGPERVAPAVVLPGDEVFKLYSTYGIPMELTREMAAEQGLGVDEAGYREALAADRRLSQAAASVNGEDPGMAEERFAPLVDGPPASAFTGYDVTDAPAGATARDATATEWRAREDGDLEVVLDETPFYPTSGGQIADTGRLEVGGLVLAVKDVQKRGSRIVHRVTPPAGVAGERVGALLAAGPVRARVDAARRRAIARAHTATHLLHAALHEIIGKEATQAGSWVGPDRLRLDFNHFRALERGELAAVERRVTEWVLADIGVADEELSLDEAMARGAMALFGEKYGERVRAVSMGGVSLELCGGTHLPSSGGVGPFAILAESSVASGVRRVEAVTGLEAQRLAAERGESLAALVKQLRVPEAELPEKVAELVAERQRLRKDLEDLRASQAASRSSELLRPAGVHGGLELMRGELTADGPKEVRGMADSLRGRLEGRVAVVLARAGGKLSFLVLVPDELAARLPAGRLVAAAAAAVGGRGGGSATLAQAGLGDEAQFETVLETLGRLLAEAGGVS
ncbi:MAG: alanine--tRNA ligase, partial [Candidatus Krumholzibacteriota bacterium]|nr:alanine--tRNA ligase [Candidatus Krumholzibacteriota bacterium]